MLLFYYLLCSMKYHMPQFRRSYHNYVYSGNSQNIIEVMVHIDHHNSNTYYVVILFISASTALNHAHHDSTWKLPLSFD